ncbi:MAG TPA: nuclear transport factor 2 family protein [Solirubrobacteraceae bacterium]|nr:nuclear transport factor 2 family protein [Solirubrobacteraceae bacterium]
MSVHSFQEAVERRDHAAMVATLAPDVVFHSPVTFRPFEGREAVSVLFGALLEVFEDFAYTDVLSGPGTHALVFTARVGDREVQGVDLLHLGDDDLIARFTVMVRPLSAATALAEAVGERLGVRRPPAPR